MPTSQARPKPQIIVIAGSMDPLGGSEPGKAWWWASALSQYFTLHIICRRDAEMRCKDQALVKEHGWTFHSTQTEITTWKYGIGYWQYARWLGTAVKIARDLASRLPIVGLYHVNLGSFRVLPRYDLLGLPSAGLHSRSVRAMAASIHRDHPAADQPLLRVYPPASQVHAIGEPGDDHLRGDPGGRA